MDGYSINDVLNPGNVEQRECKVVKKVTNYITKHRESDE